MLNSSVRSCISELVAGAILLIFDVSIVYCIIPYFILCEVLIISDILAIVTFVTILF